MSLSALGHPLETLSEGANAVIDGEPRPLPLKETRIHVDVCNGLATVTITRILVNVEDSPIEVLLTIPTPFEAVMTGLSAIVDGRKLNAVAQGVRAARATYEDAIDGGKLAVLHEEPMRGIHILSVSQLAPGKMVEVTAELTMPLALHRDSPLLRLPFTVGQVYGQSPFLPADDIAVDPALRLSGRLSISEIAGKAVFVSGTPVEQGMTIPLSQSLELLFLDQAFGAVEGRDAIGRRVHLMLSVPPTSAGNLDIAILFDRSGSTSSAVGMHRLSVHEAMSRGLQSALGTLKGDDRAELWEFNDEAKLVTWRSGQPIFSGPHGGTQLGNAIATTLANRCKPILVLTDGLTYATEVQAAAACRAPIFAILVGETSLDAMVGHLAASTGGQAFVAAGDDVGPAVAAALDAMRRGSKPLDGKVSGGQPTNLLAMRGGVSIKADWSVETSDAPCDAVGRFAAALALPLVSEEQAESLAVAHGLTCHLTSLVLVDEVGEALGGLPLTRKVPLPDFERRIPNFHRRLPDFASVDGAHPQPLPAFARKEGHGVRWRMLRSFLDMFEVMAIIDWDMLADAIARLDYAVWPKYLSEYATRMGKRDRIKKLAHKTNLDPRAVAVLLLAKCGAEWSRGAARAARFLSRGLSKEALAAIEEEARQMGQR
ncbi:VIT domain-containing protein [Enhydrobacter sp.]|uniref:VIT domain-containing protein n=1 Tax=Enhydrobacter sp. TaxID=1894999 RepID=UPI002613956D|nr:VIT domain-containing protein [Enhydrobacter sp.]WIM12547.1 MAG: hypothetical protein OJF58_003509 [Enhydrobacter sp.]